MMRTVRAKYIALEGKIKVNQYSPDPFFRSNISKEDIVRGDVTVNDVLRKQQSMCCIEVSKEGKMITIQYGVPAIASRSAART
jgi:hypothetical protein